MKHAYLIMAHDNVEILNVLLAMIDDERNDIFLHLDAKSRIDKQEIRHPVCTGFHLLKKRINVKWGGVSQIRAEMLLFRESRKNGPYGYYHLLSGVDIPLKTQSYIHNYMDNHKGTEFVYFTDLDNNSHELRRRISRYWLWESSFRTDNRMKKKLGYWINRLISFIPRRLDIEFRKGSNWVSLTEESVSYILSKEKYIRHRFRFCLMADEIFIQSLIYNHPVLREHIYREGERLGGNMRAIDWERGNPYTWRLPDKEELMQSNALFARKFDKNSMDLVEAIRNEVLKEQEV